jgi:uncharacterized membrane protein
VDRNRLEGFSDGVIAVAITLLALNLIVPGPGHGPLLSQLADRWPSFVAYLLSFFTIGIIWVNHHALMKTIVAVTRTLLFLNLVLLLFVVLIPFATAVMAEYMGTSGNDAHISMALYAAVLLGMGLAFGALFELALRRGRGRIGSPAQLRRARYQFLVGSVAYAIAFIIAFISPPASLAILGAVAVYYIFERTAALGESTAEGADQ